MLSCCKIQCHCPIRSQDIFGCTLQGKDSNSERVTSVTDNSLKSKSRKYVLAWCGIFLTGMIITGGKSVANSHQLSNGISRGWYFRTIIYSSFVLVVNDKISVFYIFWLFFPILILMYACFDQDRINDTHPWQIISRLLWQDEIFCNSQGSKGAMTQPTPHPPFPLLWAVPTFLQCAHFGTMFCYNVLHQI